MPVVVRAPDEESAREEAQKCFGLATRFPPGQGIAAAPWKRPNLVHSEIIEDRRYETDGPVEVLEPSFETDLEPQTRTRH